jgi:hypothetical protein
MTQIFADNSVAKQSAKSADNSLSFKNEMHWHFRIHRSPVGGISATVEGNDEFFAQAGCNHNA